MVEQKRKTTRDRLVPYQLPWTDIYGNRMPLTKWLWSRKFSILYLAVVWAIVGVLDFASTRRCTETWQLAFQCDQAMWMIKMYTEPLDFLRNAFTSPYFHNGLDHLLFVTIFGFVLPVQSFEVQHGSKATALVFVFSHFCIAYFTGWFFNWGVSHWPENEFYLFAFERNWMGGSVGFYGVIGALSFFSKKKWFLLAMVLAFELLINQALINIDLHISFIHAMAAIVGWLLCWIWTRFDPRAADRIPA